MARHRWFRPVHHVTAFHNKITKIIKVIVSDRWHHRTTKYERISLSCHSKSLLVRASHRFGSGFAQRFSSGRTLFRTFRGDARISLFGRLHLLFVLALFTNCTIGIKKRETLAFSARRAADGWLSFLF